ncbi:MAG TPA: 30S ribosomal protein S6 [Pirellulales bacterium]|nr:30S ribosomal protein S6 [Pirellulales bacterium]
MAQHVYEGMFILDSNRYARDAAGTVAQIPGAVEQFGGKMLASRLWEERRLAYPIKGHRKGTYWLTYFKLDGDQVGNLTRQFQLNEAVIRNLMLKIDPRIADTMVQHALTGGGPLAERKPKPEAEAAKLVDDMPVDEMGELDEE